MVATHSSCAKVQEVDDIGVEPGKGPDKGGIECTVGILQGHAIQYQGVETYWQWAVNPGSVTGGFSFSERKQAESQYQPS
jgi:hypothetical protein